MKKVKLLVDEAPNIIKEFDVDKNIDVDPYQIAAYSSKKYWWKCSTCGNTWQTSAKHRFQGRGCPQCANSNRKKLKKNKAVSDEYNLSVCKPTIAKEWNYERNEDIVPCSVSPMSHKKVWWRCQQGHEWQAVISSRVNGSGCPYCAGRIPIPGVNDLATTDPDLLQEWDYESNIDINPANYMRNSHKKVWWKCLECNNRWQANISDRTRGNGCPACSFAKRTSEPEQIIFYYLQQVFSDVVNSFRVSWLSHSSEIDIYIPSSNVAVEYDGYKWHQNLKKDMSKDELVANHGIQMVRFREHGCPPMNDDAYIIEVEPKSYDDLERGIDKLFSYLENRLYAKIVKPKVNIKDDLVTIYASYEGNKRGRSLAAVSPAIAISWNYTRNGQLQPENIANQSNKKVWWKCQDCDYEWQATVNNRIKRGCPACSNKVVWIGHNDICTKYPEMALDWDGEKNEGLSPEMFTAGSNQIVWWKCRQCGYEWKSKIYTRKKVYDSNRRISCPACAGKQIWRGHNDLLSQAPLLAEEWDYEMNDGSPDEITLGSTKSIWWKCSTCGNTWKTSVYNRAKLHSGCPKCAVVKRKNKLSRQILCVETGKIFNSLKDAGKEVNRSESAVRYCISGKTKTCGGYHWQIIKS